MKKYADFLIDVLNDFGTIFGMILGCMLAIEIYGKCIKKLMNFLIDFCMTFFEGSGDQKVREVVSSAAMAGLCGNQVLGRNWLIFDTPCTSLREGRRTPVSENAYGDSPPPLL